MIRIPLWPGVRVSIGGHPNPMAIRVELNYYGRPNPTTRVSRWLSWPGFALLAIRYDPHPKTTPDTSDEEQS